jgi:hypothetical protein
MSKPHKTYDRILVIPDQHFPFNHPDIFQFLKAVRDKFKPDKVVNLGDEVDFHSMSMHDHDPDLPSPRDEMTMAIQRLKFMYKLFPKMDVLESNHGSLVWRRAKKYGLPKKVIRSYREVLEAPKGWTWHHDLILHGSDGEKIMFCHGLTSDVLKNSRNKSMRFVQGHHHSLFEVRYWANSEKLFWGVTSGCLIDWKALAFEYGKLMLNKPILGVTLIKSGYPQLIPMILNSKGRWVNKLP